jgi:hypothetical protein
MKSKVVKAAGSAVRSRRARAYLNVDSGVVMVVTTVFLAGLIGVSFTQSFTALVSVAAWTGLPAVLGWTVPATVDSAILIFTLSALVMRARNQRRATGYAWTMLLLFTALSIAANTMHALDSTAGEDLRRVITGAVLAGCAPFVVFTASHMLSLIVIDPADAPSLRAMTKQALGDATRRDLATPNVATTMAATRDTTIEWAASHLSHPVSRQMTRGAAEQAIPDSRASTTSMVDAMIRDAITVGDMPSGAQIGAWLGDKSPRTGQRYLSALLERDTELGSVATAMSRQATRDRVGRGATAVKGVALGSRDTSGDNDTVARNSGESWAATA